MRVDGEDAIFGEVPAGADGVDEVIVVADRRGAITVTPSTLPLTPQLVGVFRPVVDERRPSSRKR